MKLVGIEYWEYIICCVDNKISTSDDKKEQKIYQGQVYIDTGTG